MNPNCTARTLTTVAPQSLLLMNDDFAVEQSRSLAERLQKEASANDAARITRAWQLLYNQTPSALDTARALVFLHRQRQDLSAKGLERDKAALDALTSFCQVLLSTNRFLYIE